MDKEGVILWRVHFYSTMWLIDNPIMNAIVRVTPWTRVSQGEEMFNYTVVLLITTLWTLQTQYTAKYTKW